MRVLIVKLTSMGDLIHALPALSDAKTAIPHIKFDWVVDEAFAEVPTWHPAVETVIKTAHRRWKKSWWQHIRSGELKQFWRTLRAKKYDLVIDMQNNFKSAVITRLTRGTRCGLDKNSAREFGAYLAYQKRFAVPIKQHAIQRQRQLLAQVLGYAVPDTAPNFAVEPQNLPETKINLPHNYLVFVHITSWQSKHYPEKYWAELIRLAESEGYNILLPWGSLREKERADRLAQAGHKTTVLPRLSLSELATIIYHSNGAICADTGLGHLTAALNKPGVHLYGSTDPFLIGAFGPKQQHLFADYPCSPCYLRECTYGAEAECFLQRLTPIHVWKTFKSLQQQQEDRSTPIAERVTCA